MKRIAPADSVTAAREPAMMGTRIIARAALMSAAVVLGSSMLAPSVWADNFTLTLDNPNAAISGFAPPYATVFITTPGPNATTATVDFRATGFLPYLIGDGGSADLNVSTPYTLGLVSVANSTPGFTPSFKDNTPGNVDGFGNFNLSLNLNDGYGSSASDIFFTLIDTGTPWANAASVLTANNQGALAAAHIFVCAISQTTGACDPNGTAQATGFAANGGAVNVPAPIVGAGLPGLVMACAGLLALARRRRQLVA
jgi:hypothetical protein